MLNIAARRVSVSRAALVRYSSSWKEGSVAQSREFGKKEKAHEDQYARKHDEELLRRLKQELEQHKEKLAELEDKVKEVESK